MARKLEVEIVGDDRSLQRALGRAGKQSDSFGKKLGGLGKTAGLVAGGAGIAAVGFAVKDVVGDMLNGQKATAQTNAVLRSTKGVANVTAKAIGSLATSLSMKSGQDDEAIQSGENLLLTFTNIRNEAGRGNDIFTQTTRIMTDMSAALGQDTSSSAIQLGKALNDPVKGVTALQRVGVSFTKGQRDQIKALVDSGHAMDAQKLILRELNKEFGGSAEAAGKTLPGQLSIAKMAFENWSESLIQRAIPAMQQTVSWLRDHWPEISAAIQRFWANVKPVLQSFYALITAIVTFVRDHWSTIGPIVRSAMAIVGAALKTVSAIIQTMAALLRGDWSGAWVHFKGVLSGVADLIRNVVTYEVNVLKAALGALRAVGAAVWGALQTQVEKIGKPFGKAVGVLQSAAAGLRGELHTLFSVLGKVIDGFRWLVDNAKKIGGIFGSIGGVVRRGAGAIGDASGGIGAAVAAGKASGSGAAAGRAFGVGPQLWDEIGMGEALGLHVTSGYRPGAKTKHGTLSDHAKHAAVDMAGAPGSMAAMFMALVGRSEIRQAFYDPLGSIFGGVRSSYREGGHSDHIHIAEYDRGGLLPPGLTLALNNTRRNETILPPSSAGAGGHTFVFSFPNYVGNRDELQRAMREASRSFAGLNARGMV